MAPSSSSSSKILITRLYRNLLRATKPFTEPSPDAKVLSCLLHRTGADDIIEDWDGYIASNPSNEIDPTDKARDLTYSYENKKPKTSSSSSSHLADTTAPSHRTYQRLFRRLLRETIASDYNGTRKLNVPSQINDTTTLREIVRREFRCKTTNEKGSSSPSSSDAASPAASLHFDIETRKQVAFTALREINKKLSYYDEIRKTAPEPLPEQAAFHVSRLPATSSNHTKPGTFLVAHPHMNDTYFKKAVICILEEKTEEDIGGGSGSSSSRRRRTPRNVVGDSTSSKYIHGIIVNRAGINSETGKNWTLKDAFERNSLPGRLSDIFGNSMVRDGGPVPSTLQMLHSTSESEEDTSAEVADDDDDGDDDDDKKNISSIGGTIIPSIPADDTTSAALYSDRATYFNGNTFKAASAIEEGSIDRDDISFFQGASIWSPGQLENEIASGWWIPCRGPTEIALSGICDHEPSPTSSSNNNKSPRPLADLWLSMMSACGEEEAKVAHLLYDVDPWHHNGQACDDFDDDDDGLDIEIDVDFF